MLMLEEIFKSQKAEYSDAFNLRIQRGISWFKKASDLHHDLDMQYLSLWIALGAVYAKELNAAPEQAFLHALFQKDGSGRIDRILWERLLLSVNAVADNVCMTQAYHDYQHAKISESQCKQQLQQQKHAVQEAREQKNTLQMLTQVLERLFTLRNLIINGGSACASAMNRKLLEHGCHLLHALLPAIILLMLENPKMLDSGQSFYPAAQVC